MVREAWPIAQRELEAIPEIQLTRFDFRPLLTRARISRLNPGRDDQVEGDAKSTGAAMPMTPVQNRLSCSLGLRRTKWSVVSLERCLLRPSLSQAISKRRPIVQAIGPVPFIRVPHCES